MMRRPWQSALMTVGIMLGVAVMVAIDLANASASRAFDLSTETIAGRATHQVVGVAGSMDQEIYTQLRRSGLGFPIAPVISEFVSSPQLGGQVLQLLGVDPFAEPPFRNYLSGANEDSNTLSINALASFLAQPGTVLISAQLADRYGLQPGAAIDLEIGGNLQRVIIAGLLQTSDPLSQRALSGLILADISTAQELTGRLNKLDRIDLILPSDTYPTSLADQLPPDVSITTVGTRAGSFAQMTSAFRINLTALSLLALVVGMFLIYNTMTFSVIQRRPLFGTLRCLGATRSQVFLLVLGEAAAIGLLGSILGVLTGIVMGQGAVRLVTQTINDLFFVVSVRGAELPLSSLIKGVAIGFLATCLTAAAPAVEAARTPPRLALNRSSLELKARQAIRIAALAGLSLVLAGWLSLYLPTRNLVISFASTFAMIVGLALLTPLATEALMQVLIHPLSRIWGLLGKMAPRDVVVSLSRTAIAVMALMVAVSVTIGVSLMVGSFRYTVQTWLDQTLQGDIYISAPALTATTPSIPIQPLVVAKLEEWPGVQRVDLLRAANAESSAGPVDILATNNFTVGQERIFKSLSVPKDQVWESLHKGWVLVSEPLANRMGLPPKGGVIELLTQKGPHAFSIAGIYFDYLSPQGAVLMDLDIYRQFWGDPSITAIALRLAPGEDPDEMAASLQSSALNHIQRLVIRPNLALRQEVFTVFDRTFAITGALQILATVVAFIGILSALLSLELERQKEMGVLRALGMTGTQVRRLVLTETGLMGLVAGVLAMPTGLALALILIFIINQRSFGWTLQLQLESSPFIQAIFIACVAALLAGIYPAIRMGRMVTAEALRSE